MMKRLVCAVVLLTAVAAHAKWCYYKSGKMNCICETSADGSLTNWVFVVETVAGSPTELKLPDGNGREDGSSYKAGSGVLDLTGFEADTGLKIVSIGGWMLGFVDSLKHKVSGKLVLPDVQSIGIDTFDFQDITEVDAPELTETRSVTGNKQGAFESCEQLARVSCPKLMYIGDATFRNCTALTDVGTLAQVTYVGSSAFDACSSLTAFPMTLPKAEFIGATAFNGVPLTGDFHLPVVTNVGGWCFTSTSLTSFHAPKLVCMNGKKTFNGCTSLTNFVAGQALRHLGTSALDPGFPSGLVSFTPLVPRALTSYYSSAMNGKAKLVSPVVWDCPAVTTIPSGFFSGDSMLSDITIGASVTAISTIAFQNIAKGATVRFKGAPPNIADKAFYYKNRGAETSNNRPRFYIVDKAAVAAWQASTIVTDNAATFEEFKTKPDYPGTRTFGLVKISSAAADTQYAWVIDGTKGLSVVIR